MKKFLFLMTMVCSLGFFASCSSSDDDNKSTETETVWKNFKGGDYKVWGELLSTSDNQLSCKLQDFKINVTKAGDNTAKITVTADDDANTTLTIPEATVTAADGYTLKGSGTLTSTYTDGSGNTQTATKDANATIKISADNKDVSAEFVIDGTTLSCTSGDKPELAELMGTWNTTATVYVDENGEEADPSDASAKPLGCVKFTWDTNEGTNIDWGGYPLPTATVAALAEAVANQQDLSTVLKSVAFTRDGRILACYRTAGNKGDDSKWEIAEDYATYTSVGQNQILVKLNTDKILSNVKDEQEKAVLNKFFSMFEAGFPIHYKVENNGSQVFFYVDKYFASGVAEDETFQALVASIQDTDLEGMGAMIKSFCSQVPELLKNTTTFEAGIVLSK